MSKQFGYKSSINQSKETGHYRELLIGKRSKNKLKKPLCIISGKHCSDKHSLLLVQSNEGEPILEIFANGDIKMMNTILPKSTEGKKIPFFPVAEGKKIPFFAVADIADIDNNLDVLYLGKERNWKLYVDDDDCLKIQKQENSKWITKLKLE